MSFGITGWLSIRHTRAPISRYKSGSVMAGCSWAASASAKISAISMAPRTWRTRTFSSAGEFRATTCRSRCASPASTTSHIAFRWKCDVSTTDRVPGDHNRLSGQQYDCAHPGNDQHYGRAPRNDTSSRPQSTRFQFAQVVPDGQQDIFTALRCTIYSTTQPSLVARQRSVRSIGVNSIQRGAMLKLGMNVDF